MQAVLFKFKIWHGKTATSIYCLERFIYLMLFRVFVRQFDYVSAFCESSVRHYGSVLNGDRQVGILYQQLQLRKFEDVMVFREEQCWHLLQGIGFFEVLESSVEPFSYERCWYHLQGTGVHDVFGPLLFRPSSSTYTLVTERA